MDVLSRPADEFDNDQVIEKMWASMAFEHAEIFFNLLCSVDPRELRLTQFDDQIYAAFRQDFPKMRIDILNENEMKSPEGKAKWRAFIEKFNKLDNYDFGTLIRANSNQEFSPENAILVIRIEFLAIEIARNREGYNDGLRSKFRGKLKYTTNDAKQIEILEDSN